MNSTFAGKIGIETWPWDQLLEPETLKRWLYRDNDGAPSVSLLKDELPPALNALISSANELALACRWYDLLCD